MTQRFASTIIELRNNSEWVNKLNHLNDENMELKKENARLKKVNKGQELEIVRLHNLADAMSGALRELGVYDVYDKQQIENRKKDTEELKQENNKLKELLNLIAEAQSVKKEESVKEILRNEIKAIDTVTDESAQAWNDYCILYNFFQEQYNEKV